MSLGLVATELSSFRQRASVEETGQRLTDTQFG